MSRTGAHGVEETSRFLFLLHFLLNSKSLTSISDLQDINYQNYFVVAVF